MTRLILILALFAVAAQGQTDSLRFFPSKLAIDTSWSRGEVVFSVDPNKVATVPRGWEYIIVIRGGQVWACDSSLNASQPQNPWRRKQ